MKVRALLKTLSCLFIFFSVSSATAESEYPIAGVTPWERPAGAPIIQWVQRDKAWFEKALTGISQPYPRSLFFLDNQGNWYSPFNRPGMLPPYDLREWHQQMGQ